MIEAWGHNDYGGNVPSGVTLTNVAYGKQAIRKLQYIAYTTEAPTDAHRMEAGMITRTMV